MDHVRAWKDPVYRASLSEQERQALPEHPAGLIELSDTELDGASGALTGLVCGFTVTLTWEAGCFTINGTFCNGTCAVVTNGCCG
jgi:mersacidin/lichenicidin family type 2 lantibiotic